MGPRAEGNPLRLKKSTTGTLMVASAFRPAHFAAGPAAAGVGESLLPWTATVPRPAGTSARTGPPRRARRRPGELPQVPVITRRAEGRVSDKPSAPMSMAVVGPPITALPNGVSLLRDDRVLIGMLTAPHRCLPSEFRAHWRACAAHRPWGRWWPAGSPFRPRDARLRGHPRPPRPCVSGWSGGAQPDIQAARSGRTVR
jgi:hypothetical protein